jgi:hypothetical protein
MSTPGYVVTSAVPHPDGTVQVHVTLLDGRRFNVILAADEWAVYGVSRMVPSLAAIPHPPVIHY